MGVKAESMEVVRRVVPKVLEKGVVMSRREKSSGSGWLAGKLAKIVKAGEAVLHSRAEEVEAIEIKSERVQKIIDDMVRVMRKAPGVGLAAPKIGIPLRIIVLEDKIQYMAYYSNQELKAQDRTPFDLLVILNPKLKNTTTRTALFFEGCLRYSYSYYYQCFIPLPEIAKSTLNHDFFFMFFNKLQSIIYSSLCCIT